MAEKFEIQSPFPVIFSGLSGEIVESLEEEKPDNSWAESLEAAPEELESAFVKSLLSIPFLTLINGEIEVLEVVGDEDEYDGDEIPELLSGDDNTVIAKRNGIPYINERVFTPDAETVSRLDRNFKRLIDSVLNRN
jgi:hypothetical protein